LQPTVRIQRLDKLSARRCAGKNEEGCIDET
jgi:hypothetical protein